jgi:hypothetical protein
MGIAKFETGSMIETPANGQGGGSSKMLITLAVIALVGYLGYKYVYLPSKEKKPENDNRQNTN